MIVFSIYSVKNKGEECTFERLVKECFILFPEVFSFKRYPEWPDSLKFDRPLRSLRAEGLIVGSSRTEFTLTKYGEKIAKDTKTALQGKKGLFKEKDKLKISRGSDNALIEFLKGHPVFYRYIDNKSDFTITEMELRNLLHCTLETPMRVVKQNLQYCINIANEYNEKDLSEFLNLSKKKLR